MTTARTDDYRRAQQQVLDRSDLEVRRVEVAGGNEVQLLESGDGPSLVLLHGTGSGAPFLRPLIDRLDGVRVIAPDRPGQGLSDPMEVPRRGFRRAAVTWTDGLLDALGLQSTALAGHSMGGLWALWYALARPDRVTRLVLLAPPSLPGTRCPLPYRVMATPGLFGLVQRMSPPSPKSIFQFADFMGERDTLPGYPELVDLLVASGTDPTNARTNRVEARAIISPLALLRRSGFRRRLRVGRDELRHLTMPTLLVWGERDPLGAASVARAVADMIPDATCEVLPAGHAPWLGCPDQTAGAVTRFLQAVPTDVA